MYYVLHVSVLIFYRSDSVRWLGKCIHANVTGGDDHSRDPRVGDCRSRGRDAPDAWHRLRGRHITHLTDSVPGLDPNNDLETKNNIWFTTSSRFATVTNAYVLVLNKSRVLICLRGMILVFPGAITSFRINL